MKSLNYIGIACMLFWMGSACSEADREMFEGPEAINFCLPMTSEEIENYRELDSSLVFRDDTIVYSFAFDMVNTERVISIPVEVTGFAHNQDRKYRVKVTDYNGAQAGVHYDPIAEEQILAAGKVKDSLQIRFHRVDMDKQPRKIGLMIEAGGDFVEGVKERLFVAVQVSDILEKPEWWDDWEMCFGPYHPIKYREWIKLYGGTGDLTGKHPNWWTTPLEIILILDLKRIFEEGDFRDENGNKLVIPDSF